jgi:hypothetical protein
MPLSCRPFLAFFGLIALALPALRAQAPLGSALVLFNAYLAQAAADNPAYRADIQPAADLGHPPAGRLSGFSAILGPFTYRPKTFAELAPTARANLLHQPGFRAFLIAARDRGGLPPAAPVAIAPEDMLRLGPLFIALPPPAVPP